MAVAENLATLAQQLADGTCVPGAFYKDDDEEEGLCSNLTIAVRANHLGIVAELLERGVSLHGPEIVLAVKHASPGVVLALLNRGASPCATTQIGRTPVLAYARDAATAAMLLDAGAGMFQNDCLSRKHLQPPEVRHVLDAYWGMHAEGIRVADAEALKAAGIVAAPPLEIRQKKLQDATAIWEDRLRRTLPEAQRPKRFQVSPVSQLSGSGAVYLPK